MSLVSNCLFCRIIEKKIPATIVHEDEYSIAFEDLNPQAPVHTLIVPKKHITDVQSIVVTDKEIIGHLFFIAKTIASQKGIDKDGYRLVINNGRGAGQSVFHLHLHLLSGRTFAWPPG
jgi:histidine triad (HIT) family protein